MLGGGIAIDRGVRGVRCAPMPRILSEPRSRHFFSVGQSHSSLAFHFIGVLLNAPQESTATSAANESFHSARKTIPSGCSKKPNRIFDGTHRVRCRRSKVETSCCTSKTASSGKFHSLRILRGGI